MVDNLCGHLNCAIVSLVFILTCLEIIVLCRHNKYFCGPNAYRTLKQAKQEKSKQKAATLKAMNTLKITKKGEELPEGAGGSGSLARKVTHVHPVYTHLCVLDPAAQSMCLKFFQSDLV